MSLLMVLIFTGYGVASKEVTIKGFRYWSSETYTRVVVDVNGPVKFTRNRLSNPARLFFDLKNCRLPKDITPSIPIGDGILKNVRAGQFNTETVRVVLDLQEIENFNVFLLKDPYRLVIDVFGKKKPEPVSEIKKGKGLREIRIVVIDPGHGGRDPGAIGPQGLLEKDVVLSVSKKLGNILRKKYGMKVIYTRKRDVFIPLEERTAIANSKKADLFISIHANASRQKRVRGIETYILNWTTNREAMRVAARENAISYKKMQQAQSDVQMILQDLARDNKKDESMRLAYNVQSSVVNTLRQDYSKIVNLGVKQALFYVLVGAEMPSILVEISFISNYAEEKRLAKKTYREKIAEAIAEGVKYYISPLKFVKKTSDSI